MATTDEIIQARHHYNRLRGLGMLPQQIAERKIQQLRNQLAIAEASMEYLPKRPSTKDEVLHNILEANDHSSDTMVSIALFAADVLEESEQA